MNEPVNDTIENVIHPEASINDTITYNSATFDAIGDFADDLNQNFGNTKAEISLALYARLLSQITARNKDAIQQHCHIFATWCQANDDALKSKNKDKLTSPIHYNEKIYINVGKYLSMAEPPAQQAIWAHLTKIYAFARPSVETRELLRSVRTSASGKEGELLGNMMEKIASNIDLNTAQDPFVAVQGLIQNGAFSSILSDVKQGVDSGQIDLGSMFATMSKLMKNP
jgi:hypothetical protein